MGGGILRPIAFAVLRLNVSMYLVGCCTGRSLGFSPNTVNVLGRLPEAFFEIKSVGDEPTGRDGAGAAEDRGQAMLQFHCNEEIFICPGNDVRQDNHSSILMRREGRYGALDFSSIVDASGGDLDAQVRRGILDRVQESLMDGGLGMKDCQYAGKVGRGLLQHLKPLAAHWAVVTGEAGHVAARTGQACYEAVADRITDPGKHDRDLPRHWLEDCKCEITVHHHNIGREREQLRNNRPHLLRSACPPAHFGASVVAFVTSEFVELPQKCG